MNQQERADDRREQDYSSAVPASASVHEAKVGIFVLFGIVSIVMALYVLTDPAWFRGRYMVSTTVSDVGGLRQGDPVQLRGVNVGRVHDFDMNPGGDVEIILEVEGDFDIPEGSRTALVSNGLLQGRVVRIEPGLSSENIEPGDHIPGETQPDLMASITDLGPQAEAVLNQMESLLSDSFISSTTQSVEEMRTLFANISSILEDQKSEVAELTQTLNRSATALETGLGEINELTPTATRMIARADTLMENLNSTTDRLDQTMANLDAILVQLNSGEGTMGSLLYDDRLYTSLTAATASLDSLMTDLRENPDRYLSFSIF